MRDAPAHLAERLTLHAACSTVPQHEFVASDSDSGMTINRPVPADRLAGRAVAGARMPRPRADALQRASGAVQWESTQPRKSALILPSQLSLEFYEATLPQRNLAKRRPFPSNPDHRRVDDTRNIVSGRTRKRPSSTGDFSAGS